MKKILIICLILIPFALSAQENNVTWNFPINPSSPKWKELKSYEEQLAAYNIPAEIIKKIPTPELVKICLAYPEWGVISAFNDRRIGLNNMMSQFNGFSELFARNDAAKELMKVYSKRDPLAVGKDWSLLQKGNYSFDINCIELLLSHSMMINKLDAQDVQVLIDMVVLKYKSKRQLPDVYSLWGLSPTAGLCLSILDKNGEFLKNNSKLLTLEQTFMTDDIEILDDVIEIAINLKK